MNELFRNEDGGGYGLITRLVCVVLAVGVGAYMFKSRSKFEPDGDPSWNSAVEQSQASGQPGLVLFTADWCGGCRYLHDNVLSRPDVRSELNDHHTFVTIDLTNPSQADSDRATKFHVSGIPTLIRFNADGKEVSRTHGLPPEKMLAWMQD